MAEFMWRGVRLEVKQSNGWGVGRAHIEIYVLDPAPVMRGDSLSAFPHSDATPLTTTGYRSHFCAEGELARAGGPVALAIELLDAAAKDNKAWTKGHASGTQLELF